MADQHADQSNGTSPRHTRIPYSYIALLYLGLVILTILITRHIVRTPPSQETSSAIEIRRHMGKDDRRTNGTMSARDTETSQSTLP